MSAASPPSERARQPDPDRASSGAPIPSGVAHLLSLVRLLINYGKNLTTTLQQTRPSGLAFVLLVAPFGTLDLAAVMAHIACGLRRAAFLEERLRKRAATGRDLLPAPLRRPRTAPPKPRTAPVPRAPTPDGLPTVEQIAAEVRRKPIGAVIADICRDLGIMPGAIEAAMSRDLFRAIVFNGGCYARYFRTICARARIANQQWRGSAGFVRWVPNPPTRALAASTGPP
jgi:hypothetical protein